MTEIPRLDGQWHHPENPGAATFVCGHPGCGRDVASERGWFTNANPGGRVYICPMCNRPTYLNVAANVQIPAPPIGRDVGGLPDDVARVYHEARAAETAGAHTSAILTARKLLMHIAVAKGAKPGENFLTYATYLVTNHWAPPGSEVWVEHWRATGNEANHELVVNTSEQARELLTFVEHILINVFELPSSAPAQP